MWGRYLERKMKQKNIKIPDRLTLISIDKICSPLHSINSEENIVFDLSDVEFVTPEALVLLVTASSLCHKKTNRIVMWKNVHPNVRSYMERMNINDLPFVSLEHPSFFKKRQYAKSNALIELSTIANSQGIGSAIIRTREILNRWFSNSSQNYIRSLSTLFKESFENSIEHSSSTPSNGFCYYALQKYTRQDNTAEIQIAVGDIGVGILASQKRMYPSTKDDVDAIIEALYGRSGRINGNGGMGFANIREALEYVNGHLAIRSGKARIEYLHKKSPVHIYRHSIGYPGTQIIFKCRA